MQLTEEQQAIVAFVKDNPFTSLVQNALAGSGKTSTMVATANELPAIEVAAACAFNKDIAKTLEAKLPPNCESRTLNAFGHRALMKGIPKRLDVKAYKCKKLLEDTLKVDTDEHPDVVRLVGLAKAYGIVPDYPDLSLIPDEIEEWRDLGELNNLDLRDGDVNLARELLRLSTKVGMSTGFIDFDDQIYLSSVFYPEHLPKFDTVFVDEAQDISAMNRAMLECMVEGRIVAVGDRHQAIYAFRGADYRSIDLIKEKWSCAELPLTICFRCARSIIVEAQRIVPAIRWHEGAPEGEVSSLDRWNVRQIPAGSAILCRNTNPLIRTAFAFIRAGIPATVKGRDIGKGLVALLKKLKIRPEHSREHVLDALDVYFVQEGNRLAGIDKEQQLILLEDKVESIRSITAGLKPEATAAVVFEAIDRLFDDAGTGKVMLSTIHKAKGLEWDQVYFLDRGLIPSRYAKTPEQLQQEQNLAYVGITRAKLVLSYISTTGREW